MAPFYIYLVVLFILRLNLGKQCKGSEALISQSVFAWTRHLYMIWSGIQYVLVTALHGTYSPVRVIKNVHGCSKVAAHIRDKDKDCEGRDLRFNPGSTPHQLCDFGQAT